MSLFDSIFRKQRAEAALDAYFQTLTAYRPVFNSYEGGIYEMEITRSAVHSIASHCSKLMPEIRGANNQVLARHLRYRPNAYMDTTKFLYLLATYLEVNNTAFIVPLFDPRDEVTVTGYYPVMPDEAEVVQDKGGTAYLRYKFRTGERAATELNRTGILTQKQYRREFFGEDNSALHATMQLISTQTQGIEQGIKNGAALRFMAKLAGVRGDKERDKARQDFRDSNLGAENNAGVLLFDARYADVKQIDSQPYVVNAAQMKLINESVYSYFGVNEEILRNGWSTSEKWQAFYEGKIEPFAIQLGLVMTNMTFTDREIACGNEIMYSANRLQYASTAEKLEAVTRLFDRGIMSTNECMDVFSLPHVEGGDKRWIRGEYMPVDGKVQEIGNAGT